MKYCTYIKTKQNYIIFNNLKKYFHSNYIYYILYFIIYIFSKKYI